MPANQPVCPQQLAAGEELGSDSIEEARYYLDAAAGDVLAAVKAYEADGAGGATMRGQATKEVQNDEGCVIA